MKSTVTIEWLVETLDYYDGCGDDPDIIEVCHFDSYAEALKWAEQEDQPVRIGLVRDLGNDIDGLIDRQWAYLKLDPSLPAHATRWILPERFDWSGGETGGAKVPARYHRELKRTR